MNDNIEKYICELCGKEFTISEGISSKRFCSQTCKRKFVNKKVSESLQKRIEEGTFKSNFSKVAYGNWTCVWCGRIFRTRKEMFEHTKNVHRNGSKSWNKGRTKEDCPNVAKYGKTRHERFKSRQIKVWCEGKHLSEEMKNKISESMKKAHFENRAHNIGESRHNNKPSWPEQWFINVIANEFDDKNYRKEFPFHRFSLDFAWPHKMKCIEIDGEQHYRFQENIERDKRKNEALVKDGWKFIRLRWKDVCSNPKHFIEFAKQFIDG